MPLSLQRAVLKTIAYADIFEYPLTLNEIQRWLIGFRIKNLGFSSKNLRHIEQKDIYYFLEGRDELIDLRDERKKWSEEKLKIAQDVGSLLKIIPTIKLVGITGALAVDNAKKEDDIDLFIITSAGLLWTTRLLSTLIIELTGNRRHPKEENVNNKICLNMFVDENCLEVPKKEQDLFSAHEVVQMKLLWEKDNTYKKFLVANQWVKKYLPNAVRIAIKTPRGWQASPPAGGEAMTPPMVEELAKRFQLWYMRNRRTTEVIKEGVIRFHPQDAREWVMREYDERIKRYRL